MVSWCRWKTWCGAIEGGNPWERALRNLLGDPLERGKRFLDKNAGQLYSLTDNGVVLKENFAQLLILEATDDWYVHHLDFFSAYMN